MYNPDPCSDAMRLAANSFLYRAVHKDEAYRAPEHTLIKKGYTYASSISKLSTQDLIELSKIQPQQQPEQ
jgi:hypothetical protein